MFKPVRRQVTNSTGIIHHDTWVFVLPAERCGLFAPFQGMKVHIYIYIYIYIYLSLYIYIYISFIKTIIPWKWLVLSLAPWMYFITKFIWLSINTDNACGLQLYIKYTAVTSSEFRNDTKQICFNTWYILLWQIMMLSDDGCIIDEAHFFATKIHGTNLTQTWCVRLYL